MRWIMLSLSLSITSICRSQSFADSTWAMSTSFEYHPYDFFFGLGIQKSLSKHRFDARLYTGVNRTFFQQRYYPKLDLHYGFDLFDKSIIRFLPEIHLAGSILNVSTESKQFAKYFELTAGLSLGFGRKNQWLFNTQYGPMWSSYFSGKSNLSWNLLYEIRYIHRIN